MLTTPDAGYSWYSILDLPDGNRALSIAEEVERNEALRIYADGMLTTPDAGYSWYSISNSSNPTLEPRSANALPTSPPADQRSALRSLARRYRARRRRKMRADNNDPAVRRKRKRTKLLDCRVSDWGEWSECRGDGGCVGSALRTRRVLRRPRPGGAPCPPPRSPAGAPPTAPPRPHTTTGGITSRNSAYIPPASYFS
ncbi:unnamed protein product [Plutella xylostella]|uniref:(diamondback moth) hypothetical protein n=1 Tax=Plutella xylostella TaxID=51655 RepID=A0A8S4G3T5_PLUXY|nr:unnamed protein product [Plutella xylostella]